MRLYSTVLPPSELHLRSPQDDLPWKKLIVETRGKLWRKIRENQLSRRKVSIDRERILFTQFPRSIVILYTKHAQDTASFYCPRGMRVPLSRFVSNLFTFMRRYRNGYHVSKRVVERVVLSCWVGY